ncbi:MAG: ribosomal L7Ae/L30e/S12e/Gadd45 family protein [Thermoanaerobacteraceae bacterium]|nr:ribosomal L7Ae/L30e/S12e/Gadd45 family protein [Thermoanaerobacteraceae bacterium]
MSQAVLNMLGFAQKAGKLVSGEEAILDKIRRGQVELVIIATDVSKNTGKKIADKAAWYGVPTYTFSTKEELGGAIGKSPRAALAIVDKNFAQRIANLLDGS